MYGIIKYSILYKYNKYTIVCIINAVIFLFPETQFTVITQIETSQEGNFHTS